MLPLVWIGVVVLALVVLGAVGYGVFGAFTRLGREVEALDREVRPVLEQVQAAQAAAEERGRRDPNPLGRSIAPATDPRRTR